MDLLISHDTCPMHIGFAMPTIALFALTAPPLATFIAKPHTSTPCLKNKCAEPFCQLQITPQKICNAVLDLLSSESIEQHNT